MSKQTATYTLAPARPRRAAVQRQVGVLPARVRHRRHGRRRDRATSASATSLVSFPVWAFATDATPGSTVTVVFPAGYAVQVESGAIPAADHDAAGGTVVLQTGSLGDAADVLRLPRRRPPGGSTRTAARPPTVGDAPGRADVRSWPDDPAWCEAGRRPAGPQAAADRSTDGSACRGRATAALIVQRGGQPDHGRLRRAVRPAGGTIEVAYYADDVRGPPRGGARLVQRRAAGRPLGRRGVRVVLRAPGGQGAQAIKAAARSADRRAQGRARSRSTPGARSAARTTTDRGRTPTPPRCELAAAIAERAGDDGATRGLGGRGRPGRRVPAAGDADGASAGGIGRARDGGRSARLARPARPARGAHGHVVRRPVADLGRARPTDLALLDARAAARAGYDAVVAQAGDWQLPRAVRDAMRAWQFDAGDRPADRRRDVLAERDAIATAAAAAGLTCPDDARDRVRGPGRLRRRATPRPTPSSRRSRATRCRGGAARPSPTRSSRDRPVGRRPEADLARARGAVRDAATWPAASTTHGRGRLGLVDAETSAGRDSSASGAAWLLVALGCRRLARPAAPPARWQRDGRAYIARPDPAGPSPEPITGDRRRRRPPVLTDAEPGVGGRAVRRCAAPRHSIDARRAASGRGRRGRPSRSPRSSRSRRAVAPPRRTRSGSRSATTLSGRPGQGRRPRHAGHDRDQPRSRTADARSTSTRAVGFGVQPEAGLVQGDLGRRGPRRSRPRRRGRYRERRRSGSPNLYFTTRRARSA